MTLEQVIAKAARITELRSELSILESELSRSLSLTQSGSGSIPGAPPDEPKKPAVPQVKEVPNGRPIEDGAIYQTMIRIADDHYGDDYDAEEFLKVMPGVSIKSIRSSLSRGYTEKKLYRLTRGKYCSMLRLREPGGSRE